MTTTTGSSAATAPLTLMSAVSAATMSIISTISRVRPSPAQAMSRWPTHVVTPVASSPSLTTNRDAMNRTVGSPKPGQRLVQRQHAGRPQDERRADGDDLDGQAVPDEQRPRSRR